jgi:hypothetical protein
MVYKTNKSDNPEVVIGGDMKNRSFLTLALLAAAISVGAAGTFALAKTTYLDSQAPGLTVHEWGTFTSVAGIEGKAIDFLPAGGPTDLPCFVNVSGASPKGLVLAEQGGRANRAMVRMETPVLYFYSPTAQNVNVKVSFPRGLMTEWYPAAILPNMWETIRNFPAGTSTIEWKNVRVMPGATETFPVEPGRSHYYAARETGSAPLEVNRQHEKFLFYRGVASFMPPVSVRTTAEGKVEVRNIGGEAIPNIVLFDNRGGKLGYRMHEGLSGEPVTFDLPELTDSLESLQKDLEGILESQGMYPREARAMVETWKDTWFEQGTRVFYIVPAATVDSILPLEIHPKPVSVARAFVGRMEVITPRTQEEVRVAVRDGDRRTLETYGRFLEPILNDFLGERISGEDRNRANALMASIRAGYLADVAACSKKR